MSNRTAGERKQRTKRLVIVGALVGVLATLAFVPPVREAALNVVQLSEQMRDAHGTFATLAVVIVVVFAIVENAEKLHFIWEMGHKLLGYDLETMERHEREFTDLPDDYTRRAALERELATELAPANDEPKLVVLLGGTDTGKTTLLNYIIPRKLNRAYKGRVILCSGDIHGIESEMGDTEEQVRRRLAKRILSRVIEHAEVPGDTGETVESMREEITEHFARDRKRPWLIVIDQIDASRFPYTYLLPALFGQRNTVLIVTDHAALDERLLTVNSVEGEEVVARRDVHIGVFSVAEAMEMLGKEVRKRKGNLSAGDTAALRPLLNDTSPGVIQRLSEIYVGGGLASVRQVLAPGLRGVRRTKVIANSVVDQFSPELKRFMAGLALFEGEEVSEPEIAALAETSQCKTVPAATLLQECRRRKFLEQVDQDKRQDKRQRQPQKVYRITKLGRGIAEVALRGIDRESELQIGAALLQFYRAQQTLDALFATPSGLRNVLGMMSWAEQTSRLPNRDVVRFIRKLRETLYYSGNWDAGFSWLQYADGIAAEIGFPRSIGEFHTTLAQLLIAVGRMHSALRRIAEARAAFGESSLQSEADLRQGIAQETTLQASLDYDALQQCWLTHLEMTASASLLPPQPRSADIEPLARLHETAVAQLQTIQARLQDTVNQELANMIALTFATDAIALALQQSDLSARERHRAGARNHLQRAQDILARTRQRARESGQLRPEMRARIEFLDAGVSRRLARVGNPLEGIRWRAHGRRCLVRCLSFVAPSSLEGALMFMEGADMALSGVALHAVRVPPKPPSLARRIAIRFSPRWYRLHAARNQLLAANAVVSALGAEATQVHILTSLVVVAGQLASVGGNARYLQQAGEYAQSARAISERLRDEAPNLLMHVQALPDWVRVPTPVQPPARTLEHAR